MMLGQGPHEIVSFENSDQIFSLPEYRLNNPLTLQNYRSILGWYDLSEKLACCVEREGGTLCGTLHNKGWVASLKDGTITILGRNCATDKFGADSTVFKDIGLAMNAIRARQRTERLRSLLSQRDLYTAKLADAEQHLQLSHRRIDSFLQEIGHQFSRRLINMARTGNDAVVVDAIRVRHYEEKGHPKQERSVIKHRLGSLNGLSAINKDQFIQVSTVIQNIRQAFVAAADMHSLTRSAQAALVSRLEECEPVLNRSASIEENVNRFFDNPKILFCFLTEDRGERSKLARLAMHQVGIDGGRDQAKAWMTAQEQALIKQLGVENIRIGV